MAETQQEAAAPAVQPLTQETAFAQAEAAFLSAEKALTKAYASIENGAHDELASARGQLSTLLTLLRASWPGGKKEVS